MSPGLPPPVPSDELFERAPCGHVITGADGTITRVNATFEQLTGHPREDLLGRRRFQELLTVGGRIYYETHYAPLLRMQGWVRAIAVEVRRADRTKLPVLVNSVLHGSGEEASIHTAVFDATDRRSYEKELLRARDQEREVAARLQSSLLAGTLPADPALDLAVSYLPADVGLTVGGDWYDAFPVGERTVALVVGDVVGRGIEAAASMGQLRSALRALASTGLSPSQVLGGLDRYVRLHDVGQTATVVHATLELDTGRLRIASAGHPPAMIVAPGEPARLAREGRSAPLDAYPGLTSRPEADDLLPPGGTLLLYTDGLYERSDQPLQLRLDELRTAAGRLGGAAATDLTRELARTLVPDRESRDDVCLLAARRV